VAVIGAPAITAAAQPARGGLRLAQCRTLLLLFLGYASCYFCRSNLSVATPLIADELGRHGMSHAQALVSIGSMASVGVFAYALGKWVLTSLGDYWGGKRNLLIATGGAAAFTLLFASSSTLPLFTMAWIGNRVVQSIGWSALVKVSSRWFHYARYGTVAAILTCSYLVGDVVARESMAWLLGEGATWRALFVFGASVAGGMFLVNLLLLRDSRSECGFAEAATSPHDVFAGHARPTGYFTLVLPLLRSRPFQMVCLLGFAATMIRETFNTWSAVYLRDYVGYSVSHAAALSAIFPGVGAVSVLIAGWLSDRLGRNCRALLLTLGLAGTATSLLVLTTLPTGTAGTALPLVMIGLVAFCLLGPYAFLPGAFALDFGGRQAGAVASGMVDGTGYLGGVAAGAVMARIAVSFGWGGVFKTLAVVSALAALAAVYLHVLNARPAAAAARS
jgi:sugar phosphate permease